MQKFKSGIVRYYASAPPPPFKKLYLQSVAPPGGQEGKFAPTLLFRAVFAVRANPLRKFCPGYTPDPPPPNFCRFVVPLIKQAMKMRRLTCEYFFCVKHKLTRLPCWL